MTEFASFYDLLFIQKAYGAEVDRACDLIGIPSLPPAHALEIGAGTGGHTLELCRRFEHVTAVEIDPLVAKHGQAKTQNKSVTWIIGNAADAQVTQAADAAFSMFYVMNYIGPFDTLEQVFSRVANALKPGGRFVFDCWNGALSLVEGGRQETRTLGYDGVRTDVHIASKVCAVTQTAELTYRFALAEQQDVTHRFSIFLWTIRDYAVAAKSAGFNLIHTGPGFGFDGSDMKAAPRQILIFEKPGTRSLEGAL